MRSFLELYYRALKFVLTLLLGVMIVPVALQIVSRFVDAIPRYIWTDEVARFCFVWMIMIGSIVAVREGSHFAVDLLPRLKTARQRASVHLTAHFAMLLMALVFSWFGVRFARLGYMQTSETSGINMLTIYIAFPLAGVSWALFLLDRMVEDVRSFFGGKPGGEP